MKAIIPAAGKGTRLQPHTNTLNKALIPVAGATVIDHIIMPLIDAGIDEITFIVGHLGEQIKDHMARYPDLKLEYVIQDEQKGLGHAVLLGLEDNTDPVVIILSDSVLELNYKEFINGNGNLLGVAEVADPENFGIVETAGRRVVNMEEKPAKPQSNLALVGLYRMAHQNKLKAAIETLMKSNKTTKGEYQLTDALDMMLEEGQKFYADVIDGWHDCGSTKNLLKTNRVLLQRQGVNEVVADSSAVDSSTLRYASIAENCQIVDSVLDNCIVLPGALIGQSSIRQEIVPAGDRRTGYTSGE